MAAPSNPPPCIFITGAASGIGRATAELFAGRGWRVGMADTQAAALEDLRRRLEAHRPYAAVADVTRFEALAAALEAFTAGSGGLLHVLFNSAGILRMGHHHRIPLEVQKRMVEVNFNGVLNAIQAAFPALARTPGSRIISMSSAAALYGTPELAVYSALKSAVSGLTEALSIEFAPFGITVSDLRVPYVRTPLITAAARQATSVRRLGVRLTPEAVAGLVWKAAHGRRVHWHLGLQTALLRVLLWALPFARRRVAQALTFDPETGSLEAAGVADSQVLGGPWDGAPEGPSDHRRLPP